MMFHGIRGWLFQIPYNIKTTQTLYIFYNLERVSLYRSKVTIYFFLI